MKEFIILVLANTLEILLFLLIRFMISKFIRVIDIKKKQSDDNNSDIFQTNEDGTIKAVSNIYTTQFATKKKTR